MQIKTIIMVAIFCLLAGNIFLSRYFERKTGSGLDDLDDEFHLHICDDCHNISSPMISNDLACHNIIIGEHSMNKTCEYCHTNSTKFTPHVGEGICQNCHGD